jgi:molybdopterin molybdotransferase
MGAADTVKEVLAAAGVDFARVAVRPGMPQGCGRVGPARTPVVTLPGNPVSGFVSFHVFVLPALRRLAGLDPDADGAVDLVAATSWRSAPGKVEYTRVTVSAEGVRPSGGQGSHVLGALAAADALAEVPAEVESVQPGDRLRCLPLVGQDPPRAR